MMLFEKMNAAMRHSAEEGKSAASWTRRKTAECVPILSGATCGAMLISAFLTIVPVVGGWCCC